MSRQCRGYCNVGREKGIAAVGLGLFMVRHSIVTTTAQLRT